MSAHLAFLAPIGSILQWSDGAPRPPERHRKKLSAWKTNNGSGRLIRKQDERAAGNITLPANFTLHEGDFGGGGAITSVSTARSRWEPASRSALWSLPP